jgi:hypothetical protein
MLQNASIAHVGEDKPHLGCHGAVVYRLCDRHEVGSFARTQDPESQFLFAVHAEDEGVLGVRSQASVDRAI